MSSFCLSYAVISSPSDAEVTACLQLVRINYYFVNTTKLATPVCGEYQVVVLERTQQHAQKPTVPAMYPTRCTKYAHPWEVIVVLSFGEELVEKARSARSGSHRTRSGEGTATRHHRPRSSSHRA